MTINIRKADANDFQNLFVLIKNFAEFIGTPEKVVTTPSQMVKDQNYINCYVVLDGDKMIGFATYFFAYYSWSGKAIYLDDLYVLDNYRGLGIGSKLLDTVIDTAKREECKKVRWQVSKWNREAIEFYKMRGALVDDVEINCDLAV
jgi:diamine N-acetyltransferase